MYPRKAPIHELVNQNGDSRVFNEDTSIIWSMLPQEITLRIFWYLDVEDLVALAFVTKDTRRIASDNTLWNFMIMKHFGELFQVKYNAKDQFALLFAQNGGNETIVLELVSSITAYLKIPPSYLKSTLGFFTDTSSDTRKIYISFMELQLGIEDNSETSTVGSREELNGREEIDFDTIDDEINFDLANPEDKIPLSYLDTIVTSVNNLIETEQVDEKSIADETAALDQSANDIIIATRPIDTRIIAWAAAQYFLRSNKDINIVGKTFKQTLQHYFAAIGDIDALGILIKVGADMSLEDVKNNSPFTLLIQHLMDNDFFDEAEDEHDNYKVFLTDLFQKQPVPFVHIYNVFSENLTSINNTPGNVKLFYFIVALAYVSGQINTKSLSQLKDLYNDINDDIFDEKRFDECLREFTVEKKSTSISRCTHSRY